MICQRWTLLSVITFAYIYIRSTLGKLPPRIKAQLVTSLLRRDIATTMRNSIRRSEFTYWWTSCTASCANWTYSHCICRRTVDAIPTVASLLRVRLFCGTWRTRIRFCWKGTGKSVRYSKWIENDIAELKFTKLESCSNLDLLLPSKFPNVGTILSKLARIVVEERDSLARKENILLWITPFIICPFRL